MSRAEKAFGFELLFELFKSKRQRADAVGLHILDIQLILS